MALKAHQRKARALTGLAFCLGFLSIAASVFIVSVYFVHYRPKEKQLMRNVTIAAEEAKQTSTAEPDAKGTLAPSKFDYPSVQASHTHFVSLCLMLTALAVGLLAVGTLILLLVVVLNRRASLEQINAALAQISEQLRDLREGEHA